MQPLQTAISYQQHKSLKTHACTRWLHGCSCKTNFLYLFLQPDYRRPFLF